ncbi:glycosyltransferase family 2 protein [Caulobacter sp. BE254]|uniref:glycosyltransferase family 2 protein n=1 Tax=Caulobacter sp. BE254 TaxID=2817720 RepID=UPI00285D2377|nr:glycosyltransferase family 2 protein [Caulobacter sp. BE254]MDR7118678.1 GT2 family glycosyltransferase [Caulobacter sp. BE254]
MARQTTNGKRDGLPAISVAIVAYQSGSTLRRCLDNLAAQTFSDFEILLIDNASSDGAPQAAAAGDPGVRLIEAGSNLGFAAGNNLAAREARGRWLVMLNPDAYPHPDWLAELMAATGRRSDTRCFASLQLDAARTSHLDGAGDVVTSAGIPYRAGYGRRRPGALIEGEVFSACGAAMMIDRALFLEMGGFDETFFCYCEDVDLGYRLQLRGEPIVLAVAAEVDHVGSATFGLRSPFSLYHGTRNRLWTFVKNTPPLLFWLGLAPHAAITLTLLLVRLPTGDAKPVWRGLRDALAGLPGVWRTRRQIQAARKVGSAHLLRTMAWDPVAFLRRVVVIRARP